MRRAATLAPLALLALGAMLCAPPATAQIFRVFAFGDSIVHAVGFDTNSECKAGDPDTCGFVGRLASSAYFGCNSSDCQFVNRGVPGERTSQGLTRLDQVLREKDWDLFILLEGTNDVGNGVSAQTAEFNMRQMAEKAKKQNVATALASTIWLHPSFERESTNGRNGVLKKLRALIQSQASSSRRCFVDAWNKLCPEGPSQENCFNKNYWRPPAGQEDFVGHPNGKGYDVLAKEFFRVLGSAGEPGAVELVSPSGEACGSQAKLTWLKETVAGTTCGNWFRVQVDGDGGNELDAWYPEGDLCTGTECTLISPVDFDDGTHSIRIRNRNTRGTGPWSKSESFTIVPFAPKKVDELLGPVGESFSTGGLPADFTWAPVGAANSYRLELVSSNAGVLFDDSFDAGDVCDADMCAVNLGDPLTTGEYTWRVLAENICGGGWSEAAKLVVFDGPPAFAPVAVSPTTRIFDRTPRLRWNTVFGATQYEVEDPFGTTTVLEAADHCIGGVCRFDSAALAAGPHTWRVRAVNPLGAGIWSNPLAFEVADCDCFEGKAAGGSSFLIAVPETWNGDLVIWAHDSNYFGVREVEDFGPLAQRQFNEGYALATTSYSVTGWPLFKSKRDLEKLYSVFETRYGTPGSVYIAGEGTGALVAMAAVEEAQLGNLVGALPTCGPLGGAANWRAAFDLRLAYDAICSQVGGASIPGGAKGLPKPNDLEPADIRNAVNVCTGVDFKRPLRSDEQKARLRELLRINSIVESGLQDAMQQATFGLYDLVRDKRKLKGRLPVGNDGVDYGSPAINSLIQRAQADPKAVAKLSRFYEPSGEIGETKVISLHTSEDAVFFVENQRDFADLVPEANLTTGVVIETKASHCEFSEPELLAAWRALTIWTEGGGKPRPKRLQSRCNGIKKTVKGACRFDKRPKLDPLDTRLRPRP